MLRPLLAAARRGADPGCPAAAAAATTTTTTGRSPTACSSTLDDRWDEQAGYYKLGGGGVEPMANSMLLLTHSVAAMQGHEGPARNDAPRPRRSPPGSSLRRARTSPQPGAGQVARARLGELDERPRRPAPRVRRRGRGRPRLRLPRARGAAAARRDRDEDPQRDPPHRPRLVLALPDDPAQPGQLVRADVRRRRDRHRRQHAAASATCPCSCGASSPARAAAPSRVGNFGPGMRFHYLPGHVASTRR